MNILLITGGWSSEREVSLAGGAAIEKALRKLGHDVRAYDPAVSFDQLPDAARNADFAFINLHGSPGEDGVVQAMLDRLGCPYQGADPAASFLALDKSVSKILFARAGLDTPEGRLLNALPAEDWQPEIPYPLFIKANTGGSSLHMAKARRPEDLHPILKRLFAGGSSFLVERAVSGTEITCGVLGSLRHGEEIPEALPLILIKPCSGDIFDYQSKYVPGRAVEICPAPLPAGQTAHIQEMAVAAHRALGISGYSRADFILSEDGRAYILEINTLPGMTGTSLLPQAAAAAGMTFEQLIARLIDLGLARHKRRG